MSASQPADPVIVYTDGACSGNPGPGGWAALLRHGASERVLTGAETHTTNNRMEMMAVLEALRALKRPCAVRVHTDSAYVQRAFAQGWLANWQRNGWKTASKKPVENQDLWQELLRASEPHQVEWVKVKGHAGNPDNERVDGLAVLAMKEHQQATRSAR
jgi:ribonuclease HI